MTRLAGALLCMIAAPIAALAQAAPDDAPPPDVDVDVDVDVDPNVPPPQPPTYEMRSRTFEMTTVEVEPRPASGFGVAISAGGGFTDFVNETARKSTAVGGAWDVRATIGTRSYLAAEVAYVGSAQAIDALGLDDDAILVGNGVQGAVRVNFSRNPLQPFAFAGVAWRHFELTNVDTNTSDVSGEDDVIEIPVGLGLAYRNRGLFLDLRGEFRPTTQEDLMPPLDDDEFLADDGEAALHRWGVNATIGYEF